MVELTDKNFDSEVLNSKDLFLVDFWAEWCGPCKGMFSILEKVSNEYKDRLIVGKLDVGKYPDIGARFNILSMPNLLFFRNGKVLEQIIGLEKEQKLLEKIKEILSEIGSK
ncbi:MAG TPA: thioredoxin [Terriglobales bacterium]|nr:thioredoxin [Terriglobales bacterium]